MRVIGVDVEPGFRRIEPCTHFFGKYAVTQALRVAHFGEDSAKKLYGAEEELTRSLLELMRQEKDQSLTMEEKAARAQRLRDTMQR